MQAAPDLLVEWAGGAPNRRALVLGAGGGAEARWLLKAGFQVEAVERDAARAAELAAEKPGADLRVHALDARQYDFAPDNFGLVVALALLHFIPPDDRPGLARRMIAGLAPRGRLIAQALVAEDDPGGDLPAREGVHWLPRGELRRLFDGLDPLLDETYRFADSRRMSGFATGASLVARKPPRSRG